MHLVSNMISIIKIGILNKKLDVIVPSSNYCINILSALYKLGFIRGFVIIDHKNIRVLLKYIAINHSIIRNIRVISKPSRRIYWNKKHIKTSVNHRSTPGYFLISTNLGILTNYECQIYSIGGEVILNIN